MVIEHRLAHEFRVSGRVLSGAAMVFGDTSPDFNERFMPGALQHSGRVDINLQHDSNLIVARGAVLTDTGRELRVRAELEPGSAALALVKRSALNAFSIEFHARSERREAGTRVIERADLSGLALVDRGAYPQAVAEIRKKRRPYTKGRPARLRAGRLLRAQIPIDQFLVCECIRQRGPGTGAACLAEVRFSTVAAIEMADLIGGIERDILCAFKDFSHPLASAKKQTLRAGVSDEGLELAVDLPDGRLGDAVVEAHSAAGIVVRPFIDPERSQFFDTERARVFERPYLRAMLISSTDASGGWPVPKIEFDDTDGKRAAPVRRRLWL